MEHPEDAVTEKEWEVLNGVWARHGVKCGVSLHLPDPQSDVSLNVLDCFRITENGEFGSTHVARPISSPGKPRNFEKQGDAGSYGIEDVFPRHIRPYVQTYRP